MVRMGNERELALEKEIAVLRRENEQLSTEIARLTTELQAALARIAELEAALKKPPGFVKPKRSKEDGEKKPRRKRAARHNTSRKRSTPTRIERHALARCPECQYELQGESLDYSREVVELPPPQPVEVIEHQVVKRWCPCCKAWRSPQLDLSDHVFGQGRIGKRIASLVAYLRTELRLPVRQVQSYLQTVHELQLSAGEIVELTHQVRRALQHEMKALHTEIQASKVVHGDETGWRENGHNGYVWAFISRGPHPVHYFVYHQSRARHIPQGILGLDFRGHLISDFYAAYNVIRGPHQRCWVHLLRDLHALQELHLENSDVCTWIQSVHRLYTDGQQWLAEHPQPTDTARAQQYATLLDQGITLGQQYALVADHPCRVLAKRLLRHQDELFQFVRYPDVPADNNMAERALRPLVIMRKISGGSRSAEGSKTRLTLFSLFRTWQARGLNPFAQCLRLLQPTLPP